MRALTIEPGLRRGSVVAPPSKSHAHRLLIANFLAALDGSRGARALPSSVGRVAPRPPFADEVGDSADILATKRCLRALDASLSDLRPLTSDLILDCGESGSTLRFLAPIAAALGKTPQWIRRGRLAERPFKPYPTLEAGLHELPGDVSSQFVTGLLFALPLLKGDSQIRFTTPLESRGYVDMTLEVLRGAGVEVRENDNKRTTTRLERAGKDYKRTTTSRWGGFEIAGGQRYRAQPMAVEGDWSGAAFWLAMNALGSDIEVTGLNPASAQPDRAVETVLRALCLVPRSGERQQAYDNKIERERRQSYDNKVVDVSPFPDIFPVLAVVAAAQPRVTRFVGIRRLRLKESDRVAAMADVLGRFGRKVEVTDEAFVVEGAAAPFRGGAFTSFGDHRIAMSIAVGATIASKSVEIDNAACAAKSYPNFFETFQALKTGQEM